MIDRARKQAASGLRLLSTLLPKRGKGAQIARTLADVLEKGTGHFSAINENSQSRKSGQTPSSPPPQPEAAIIDAPSLRAALEKEPPPVLLDVREPQETAHGVIPGARLIPMQSVLAAIGELRQERPVVVYCAHGVRSRNVVTHLRDRGVEALSLVGGIEAWRAAGGQVQPPT